VPTLYGDLDSGNVYKVRLLLAQLGMSYRRVDTTQNRGEPATAEFRAMNPIGKIPTVMLDDGRVLSESGAILFYFARDTALFPADAWGQATVLRWIFFEQYSHEPHIAVNRHWKLHLSPTEHERLAQRIADNHRRGNHALDVMEQQLGGNAEGGFDLQPYHGIRRWLERVHAQPGYIPQMQEEPGVLVVRWPG
jgi:glutathione S-transferase